jgi:hypothetical protein
MNASCLSLAAALSPFKTDGFGVVGTGLQLRDLRHEAGSRFDEAGVPISYTSRILGHTNLNTTSRYLNIHRRGLQDAMQKLEQHRPAVAHPLHTAAESSPRPGRHHNSGETHKPRPVSN